MYSYKWNSKKSFIRTKSIYEKSVIHIIILKFSLQRTFFILNKVLMYTRIFFRLSKKALHTCIIANNWKNSWRWAWRCSIRFIYAAISVRNRKAAITAFNVRGWGLDIHVFKFIYWQDFCSLEGDSGRKAGPGFHPFWSSVPPSPSPHHSLAIRSVVKPSMLYNPFWVIFSLKEISANYTGCPTGVEF